MARPRVHDLDALLDAAERIVTDTGSAGLTLRALATAAGASNGSIYHAFSSKEEILARAWLRASERFLALLDERLEAALVPGGSGEDAVVAAALAPVGFTERHPESARLFFGQRRDQLFTADVPAELVERLDAAQERFTAVLVRLAEARWQRRDAVAVEAIAACVVDLPGGLLRRQLLAGGRPDPQTGPRIEASTRAILQLTVPAPTRRSGSRTGRRTGTSSERTS